ncbi:MAG TPA: DinB family protein [Gemmatimonadaceae bacterium]|nr:DinB family protein [Gemmatimonadaceae bacterium]
MSSVSVIDRYFDDLDTELAATRRLLERFPAAHADWTPHEKSMPLARLAAHVAELPGFAEAILTTDEFDFATTPYQAHVARTAEELVALHDRASASARATLASMPEERLEEQWTLRAGDQVLLRGRRGKLLRQNLVSHIAHHRGQLTVYYRMLGVPLPGIYGPSADER